MISKVGFTRLATVDLVAVEISIVCEPHLDSYSRLSSQLIASFAHCRYSNDAVQ